MSVIIILIVISFSLAISFLLAFLWAVKNNQYYDNFTPSVRILTDENIHLENKDKK